MQWYIYALIAAGLLAAATVTRKQILFKEGSSEYSLIFIVLTGFFTSFFVPFTSFKFPLKIYGIIILISLMGLTAIHYFFKALKHFEVSLIFPLTNIQPIIVLFLSIIFLSETVSLIQLLGIALILVGGYVLELNSHINLFHPIKLLKKSRYQRYVFGSIMLVGFVIFLDKVVINAMQKAQVHNPQYAIASLVWMFMAVFTIGFYSKKFNIHRTFKRLFQKEGIFIMLPSFLMAVYLGFYYKAVSLHYISLVAPIIKLSSLFAVVFGGKILHEKNILFKSIACIIMIIGTFFIVQ